MIEYSGKLSIEAATAIAQANYNQKTQEEIITLKQRIAELESFKTMLIEALIISHIYSSEHETDAKKALHDLIGWEVKIALDPQVSSDAEALIQKGRDESKQRIADLEAKQNDLLSLIYNSAIGSLAMGFSVDISHIASEAYGITGISAEQLSQQPDSGEQENE